MVIRYPLSDRYPRRTRRLSLVKRTLIHMTTEIRVVWSFQVTETAGSTSPGRWAWPDKPGPQVWIPEQHNPPDVSTRDHTTMATSSADQARADAARIFGVPLENVQHVLDKATGEPVRRSYEHVINEPMARFGSSPGFKHDRR